MTARQAMRVAAIALALTFAIGLPALAAPGPAHSAATSTVAHETVKHPGQYTVMVSIAPTAAAATVNVTVASQTQSGVPLGPGTGQSLAFFVKLKTKKFTVRAVGSGARVHFTVAVASEAAASASPSSGPYRHLAWSDDFTGPAGSAPDPSKWSPDVPGNDCGAGTLSSNTASPANASLDGQGDLAITAIPDSSTSNTAQQLYTSAQIDTNGHYSFTYGRIEARVELPPGAGLCPAVWLLAASSPVSPCAAPCPEIDIMETASPYPDTAFGSLHGPAQISNALQYEGSVTTPTPLSGTFHTWGLIWQPGKITWTLDGLPYATATPSTLSPTAQWVFDGATMRIILDLSVGGWWALDPTSTAGFPATMRVQWVRVYQ